CERMSASDRPQYSSKRECQITVGRIWSEGARRPSFSGPRPKRLTVSHHCDQSDSETIEASKPFVGAAGVLRFVASLLLLRPNGASGAEALDARFKRSKKPRIFL